MVEAVSDGEAEARKECREAGERNGGHEYGGQAMSLTLLAHSGSYELKPAYYYLLSGVRIVLLTKRATARTQNEELAILWTLDVDGGETLELRGKAKESCSA